MKLVVVRKLQNFGQRNRFWSKENRTLTVGPCFQEFRQFKEKQASRYWLREGFKTGVNKVEKTIANPLDHLRNYSVHFLVCHENSQRKNHIIYMHYMISLIRMQNASNMQILG